MPVSKYNKHHLFWQRSSYTSCLESNFRSHPGLIIPVLRVAHSALHAEMFGPPKPTDEQMEGCIDYLGDSERNVYRAIDYFNEVAETEIRPSDAIRAHKIGLHLLKQSEYLPVYAVK